MKCEILFFVEFRMNVECVMLRFSKSLFLERRRRFATTLILVFSHYRARNRPKTSPFLGWKHRNRMLNDRNVDVGRDQRGAYVHKLSSVDILHVLTCQTYDRQSVSSRIQ